MKKALIYWFVFLITLLVLTSCKCKHQTLNNVTENDSINTTKNVYKFNSVIDRSLAINDVFKIGFPTIVTGAKNVEDCDSLCNQKIKEALSNVKTSKTSGNNSYKFYYDKYTNELVLNANLGETINKYQDSVTILKNELSVSKKQVKEIPVIQPLTKKQLFLQRSGIAFWILLVAVCGWKFFKFYKKINPVA